MTEQPGTEPAQLVPILEAALRGENVRQNIAAALTILKIFGDVKDVPRLTENDIANIMQSQTGEVRINGKRAPLSSCKVSVDSDTIDASHMGGPMRTFGGLSEIRVTLEILL